MANATLGEPLALRNAIAKYAAQSTYGTAASLTTTCGIARAGHRLISSNKHFKGPGSELVIAKAPGGAYTAWQLQIPAVQISLKALLQKALRVNGTLPYLTLGFGYEDDVTPTSNKSMNQIKDCVVDQLEISLEAGSDVNPLTATLSGPGAPSPTVLTNQSRATLADVPWISSQANFTEEGSAFEIERFNVSINNNVSRDHMIRGAAPSGNARGHSYLTVHGLDISGAITVKKKPSFDVHGTSVLNKDLLVVLTSGSDLFTLSMLDCDYDNLNEEQGDDGIRWSFDFTATSWNLT
jgi:hypothetical protein